VKALSKQAREQKGKVASVFFLFFLPAEKKSTINTESGKVNTGKVLTVYRQSKYQVNPITGFDSKKNELKKR